MEVTKLDFHAGEDAIFFFVDGEQLRNSEPHSYPSYYDFFSHGDYIRLKRPQDLIDGIAFDHMGRVLTNRSEILTLIETSLKLPRASPGIMTQTYFFGDKTDYNFHVISFPELRISGEAFLVQRLVLIEPLLVIPKCLSENNSSKTNRPVDPAMSH
jgi:hypothetical protein